MDNSNPRIAPRRWRGRYGPVVLLLVASIVTQAVPPDAAWERILPVLVEGATLLFIFWTSDVRRRTMLLATTFVILAIIAAATATSTSTESTDWGPKGVGAIMALVGPVVIVRYLGHQGRITLQSLWGALCIYLLAGLFFAYAFGDIAAISGHQFFVQHPNHEELNIDYIYFSFVTLTTVGYGDLTASQSLGKMLAVSEALLGQLYLVGVVALVASNIGMTFQGRFRPGPSGEDGGEPVLGNSETDTNSG